jgi:hypothetical protein
MNIYIIIIIFIIIILSKNNKFEFFTNALILNDIYSIKYKVKRSEIFPLKKYKFYNYEIYGPAKINYLKKFYGQDVLTHGKKKYGPNKKKFKITNFEPAKINKNFKGCTSLTKRCEFWNKNNTMIPPCCARKLNDLLKHIIKILKKYNIEYFAYWGTIIGAIRHGGIIPWDTDIDIYISRNDSIKIKNNKNIRNDLENNIHKIIFISDVEFKINYSKKNFLHVDIFIYD